MARPRFLFRVPCGHRYYDTVELMPELSDSTVDLSPIQVAKMLDKRLDLRECDYELIPPSLLDSSMEVSLQARGWVVYEDIPDEELRLTARGCVVRWRSVELLCGLCEQGHLQEWKSRFVDWQFLLRARHEHYDGAMPRYIFYDPQENHIEFDTAHWFMAKLLNKNASLTPLQIARMWLEYRQDEIHDYEEVDFSVYENSEVFFGYLVYTPNPNRMIDLRPVKFYEYEDRVINRVRWDFSLACVLRRIWK